MLSTLLRLAEDKNKLTHNRQSTMKNDNANDKTSLCFISDEKKIAMKVSENPW